MKHIFLAASFVLIGAADWQPQILTLQFPDGHEERLAATSPATCETAVRAIRLGMWEPTPARELPTANCAPGSLFRRGSEFIPGFNAPVAR